MKQSHKYLILASLYTVQSVPLAFFKTGFQLFLKDQGIEIENISRLMGLMLLPWVIKFFWAPLVDKWCANRLPRIRYAILLFQLLGAFFLGINAVMLFPQSLHVILGIFLMFNFVAATQDIAIDALAVLTLPKREHGLGNIFQIGGYYLGEVLGGALILIIFDQYGWNWAMCAFAVFFLIPFIPVLLYKTGNQAPVRPPSAKGFKNVKEYLRLPGMYFWLLVMIVYMGNQILSRTLLPYMFDDIGYTKTQIVGIISIWGNTASVLAAVVGGLLVNRLGRKNSLVGFGILKVIALLGFFLIKGDAAIATVYSVIIINDFVSGLAMVTLFTIMMDKCRLTSPGSDFTVQQSVNLMATLIFVAISGGIVKAFGGSFTPLFVVAFIVGLLGVFMAAFGISRSSLDNGNET